MKKPHSTLKLVFGNESFYYKTNKKIQEYSRINDVAVNIFHPSNYNYSSIEEYMKSLFWKNYSKRMWSYDDFNFNQAPAAVSFLSDSNIYRVWYNPLLVYELIICANFNTKNLDNYEFLERFRKGKLSKSETELIIKNGINLNYYNLLIECKKQNGWINKAWQQHCQYIIDNSYYRKTTVGVLLHEMMHVLWNHIARGEDKNNQMYNIAADYAINQKIGFPEEICRELITDKNKTFFDEFIYCVSKWSSNKKEKDKKYFEKCTKDKDNIDYGKLYEYFVAEPAPFYALRHIKGGNKYLNRDADFYYDVLLQNENSKSLDDMEILDDHQSWDNQENKEETENFNQNNKEFDNIKKKNENNNILKRSLKESGYDPNDEESVKNAIDNIPGMSGFTSILNEWFSVKTKNWKKEISSFLTKSIDPTELEYTMMREHRALDDVFPGKKRDLGFEIIIAIDTSASVFSGNDLNDFVNQIYKISKDCNVIKIRVIQCHTRISDDRYCRINSLKSLKNMKIKEIGGTTMKPIFEKLKEEKNKKPLILFTDGEIDSFSAYDYKSFKHVIFLSRGHENMVSYLENNGFKVICQDNE